MESCHFCSFSSGSDSRFVCCTWRKHGGVTISVTDGADVWSSDVDDEDLETFTQKLNLKSPDDLCPKLRSGDLGFEVSDGLARLRSVSGPNPGSVLDLTKMAAAAAKQEVKTILFKMADSLSLSSERVLIQSPAKNQQRRTTEFEPRQNSAPCVTTKKRLPGTSLINPGTKKKRAATGVAFDDPDDA